jgi:SAM-dependent methyltransferase
MSDAAPRTILDVRPEEDFLAGHAPGAVNIPAPELAARVHELPPKGAAIALFDDDPDRLAIVSRMLHERGYAVEETRLGLDDLSERGPSRARLWQPSPFLVEALERIGVSGPIRITGQVQACRVPRVACNPRPTEARLASKPWHPGGRAMDLACGSGREAVWLALAGYEVEAIDVLPDALERAEDLARRSGVRLTTIRQDLRRSPALPQARYDLVTVLRFLHRPLLSAIRESVAPGGFVVYEAFHRRDAAKGRRPLKDDHTLEDGELAAAFAGYEAFIARDGVERDGRAFSQFLGRRGHI